MTTVLLVDDSPVDRRLFGSLLEQNGGYRVQYAEHGAAALQTLEQGLPDLVVTDMQMPHMDGLQLVTSIRNRYPQLPVIAMYHGNLELTAGQLESRSDNFGSSHQSSLVEQRMTEAPCYGRKISVVVRMNRDEARFTINDEGPGFNVREFSEVGLSKAAVDSGRGGQGLFLMWAFMDRVRFNRIGNAVTLIKRRQVTARESHPESSVAVDNEIA